MLRKLMKIFFKTDSQRVSASSAARKKKDRKKHQLFDTKLINQINIDIYSHKDFITKFNLHR